MKRLRNINYIYNKFLKTTKVNKKKILFESFHGKAFIGDPYAMLLSYLDIPKYKDFRFIVIINDIENIPNDKVLNSNRVTFIQTNTKKYLFHLATSKYLINSVSFPPYLVKREEQVYLNTWHGTPYKTLGKDMKNVKGTEANIVSNFLKSDLMIHASDYTCNKIESSHGLHAWNGQSFLSAPRLDLYKENDYIKIYLSEKFGINFDKPIILYCPTWTGNLNKINASQKETIREFNRLKEDNPDKVVLLKVHSLVYSRMSIEEKEFVVDDKFDIIELMYYMDTLITDYSSAFFDFMYTGKKIIHYMPDYTEYKQDRGLYLSDEELPGEIARNYEQLKTIIKTKKGNSYKDSDKYNYFISPEITTSKLIEIMMNYKAKPSKKVKKDILLYAGGFANNGVTTSLINFSYNFNYDDYNLHIIERRNLNEISTLNLEKVDKRANIIYRSGSLVAGLNELYRYHKFLQNGNISKMDEVEFKKLFKREHKRQFGNMTFDIYIDFSGYVSFWTTFMAFSNENKKFIYQHNDMYREYYKVINNERVHFEKLTCVFGLYKYFDKVIAVSEEVKNENLRNLNKFYTNEQACNIGNYLNIDRLLKSVNGFKEADLILIKKIKKLYDPEEDIEVRKTITCEILEYNIETFENISKISNPIFCGYFGRFSPEKGQVRFLNKFNEILKVIPNLVIIFAGEGPQFEEAKKVVKVYGIEANVIFTGHLQNPYPLMLFVDIILLLSSSEGQPMVLLEALALGKKIIASDIDGNRSVLKSGHGMLIKPTVEEIIRAINNFEQTQMFDVNEYHAMLNDAYNKLFESNIV
ncbi:MAG: CDP-glycerol glycerophosphotransferase family protein [Bacilli bacterium]